jgi:hypothetical protein
MPEALPYERHVRRHPGTHASAVHPRGGAARPRTQASSRGRQDARHRTAGFPPGDQRRGRRARLDAHDVRGLRGPSARAEPSAADRRDGRGRGADRSHPGADGDRRTTHSGLAAHSAACAARRRCSDASRAARTTARRSRPPRSAASRSHRVSPTSAGPATRPPGTAVHRCAAAAPGNRGAAPARRHLAPAWRRPANAGGPTDAGGPAAGTQAGSAAGRHRPERLSAARSPAGGR